MLTLPMNLGYSLLCSPCVLEVYTSHSWFYSLHFFFDTLDLLDGSRSTSVSPRLMIVWPIQGLAKSIIRA